MRVGGGAPLVLTRALAKTVILLAARGGPVRLGEFTKELAVGDNSVHQNISKLRKLDIPIAHTGRGDTGEYHLDPAGCLIDAQEFARGADGQDIDAMLRLWRGPLPEFPQFLRKGLDAPCWATVKAARSRIIQRISELSEADRLGLAELPRFAGLFPGDQEVDRIWLSAPDAKPRLQAADAESPAQAAQKQLTLTVNPAPPLVITTTSLSAATAVAGYSQQLAAAGGTGAYTWRLASGTLPAGLILSSSGRLWTGDYAVTTAPGTYDFTVQAADGESPAQTVQQQLTLTVNPGPPFITPASLPAAIAGTAYSQQLTAGFFGNVPFHVAGLPAGMTLSVDGLLSGTPATPGTYNITVAVPTSHMQQQLTLTVNPAPLVITTTSLPAATVGTAYSQQLRTIGGLGLYTWTLASGTLPAGLTLSTSGLLSGTPMTPGTNSVTVQAADGESPAQSVQQQLTLTVNAAPLVITTTSLPAATAGTAYSQQLTATGGTGTYTWALAGGTLPAGLALSASGLISGTPTSSGTPTFTVQAADAESPAQTAHQQFTLTVHAAPLLITTRSLPNASVDHAYTQQLRATGGTGPYTWTLASGRLPAGITLSREGALHGEPWAAGTYVFTMRATDSQWQAQSVTERLSITVAGDRADLAVSVTGPSSARAGSRVTYTVTVKDNGPAWASRVSVSLDTDGLTDVRASDAGRVKLAESRDVAQASAAWYAAGLAPGQALTFTVTGTVPAKGLKDISAIGQIQSPTSDPNPRNNTSTVTTKVH
jgi:hypothetical protein